MYKLAINLLEHTNHIETLQKFSRCDSSTMINWKLFKLYNCNFSFMFISCRSARMRYPVVWSAFLAASKRNVKRRTPAYWLDTWRLLIGWIPAARREPAALCLLNGHEGKLSLYFVKLITIVSRNIFTFFFYFLSPLLVVFMVSLCAFIPSNSHLTLVLSRLGNLRSLIISP